MNILRGRFRGELDLVLPDNPTLELPNADLVDDSFRALVVETVHVWRKSQPEESVKDKP